MKQVLTYEEARRQAQQYQKVKLRKVKTQKNCFDGKPLDIVKTKPVVFVRPPAIYSNKRIYDLI